METSIAIISAIAAFIVQLILIFILVSLAVLCFGIHFGLEWSFPLCCGITFALMAFKSVFSGGEE